MKKIDLHVHTVPTVSDSDFVFSMDTLKRYVQHCRIDAIAVTNHNVFDSTQFRRIKDEISIVVLPGIEINVGTGHLLMISDGNDLADFDTKCLRLSEAIRHSTDSVSVPEIVSIFGDLSAYMLIPHIEKNPSIKGRDLEELMPYVCAGEVDSAKKFVRAIKGYSTLCPVLFSDSRMKEGAEYLSSRQTYVDCGEISLAALKACFVDKNKVFLSRDDGNILFQVFDNGQHISTGLNVLLGDRSSGKTYTLDKISERFGGVKYIRQFELVQKDDDADEKIFKSEIQRRRSRFVDDYLSGFRSVIDDVAKVDIVQNERELDAYVTSLLKSAAEADRRDAFSKVRLFDEVPFFIGKNEGLKKLIASVIHLAENVEYRETIEKHLSLSSLKNLARELIEKLWEKVDENRDRNYVNAIIKDVKDGLRMRTAATQVENVDFYKIAIDEKKVRRFKEIVSALQKEACIFDENVQGFRIVASKGKYSQASELVEAIKSKAAFKEALKNYNDPYVYLSTLMGHEKVDEADIYKLFVKITYRILNRDGSDVSGGERSEFRLLQEIKNAQNYDLLLIDEPESSFDNMFLKSDVNQLIRDISRTMPVIVVTHNNTVGATIKPDYILYAQKSKDDKGGVKYRLYSGYPTDKHLKSIDDLVISNFEVLMNSLEAGKDAYEGRRQKYEAIES
jgi:ABC-type dipeptide/oligopeptide/nickel transport system ATPase subunit